MYPSTKCQNREPNEPLNSGIEVLPKLLEQNENCNTETGNHPIPQKGKENNWSKCKSFFRL